MRADLKNDVKMPQNIVQPISATEKQVTSKLDGKYKIIVNNNKYIIYSWYRSAVTVANFTCKT